jgi:hypothetical protein
MLPNIKETWIRRNPWCKEFRHASNSQTLADLIQKRLEYPKTTGPCIYDHNGEEPSDIIVAFILNEPGFRKIAEPAVGLLLWKLKNKQLESKELLSGVFDIIRETKLAECSLLLYKWLKENYNYIISDDDKEKKLYRVGMVAYAYIQQKDIAIENYWYNIWKEAKEYWWSAAFLGLRLQNPKLAALELHRLIGRDIAISTQLLVEMWKDERSKSQLEMEIKSGMDRNSEWSGLALNSILEKLSDSEKAILLINIKEHSK